MSMAVCDPEAFFPLRSLVAGPFTDLRKLADVERLVRAVVLHDEISMDLEPFPYDPDSDPEFAEDEEVNGARNVIVSMGPVLTGYDFFTEELGPGKPQTPKVALSPALIEAARGFSNAEEGNVYFKAHVEYLQRIVGVVLEGGSAVLAGEFGSAAIDAASRYPEALFESLDTDWQQFARDADAGGLGFMVPPVLSIILTRCERRDAIPAILTDLRDEWADARAKVWRLLGALRTVDTLAQKQQIQAELALVSRFMSPAEMEIQTRPARVLWELVAVSAAGAGTALLSGGRPGIGAAVGALGAASRSVLPLIQELGPALFGRGAFDLARRVRKQAMGVDNDAFRRLLTDSEKERLRL